MHFIKAKCEFYSMHLVSQTKAFVFMAHPSSPMHLACNRWKGCMPIIMCRVAKGTVTDPDNTW